MTITVGAFEAKTHLSTLLDRVGEGEEVINLLPVRAGRQQFAPGFQCVGRMQSAAFIRVSYLMRAKFIGSQASCERAEESQQPSR